MLRQRAGRAMPADEDCIFCQIIGGRIPAKTVHEDDRSYAFLDINPLSRGHTLLVPKAHHAAVEDMSVDEFAAYMAPLPELVAAVQGAVGAKGSTIAWNNGRAAGQEVGHVHLHIVPRFDGDEAGPIHGMFHDRPDMAGDEIDDLAARIRKSLS